MMGPLIVSAVRTPIGKFGSALVPVQGWCQALIGAGSQGCPVRAVRSAGRRIRHVKVQLGETGLRGLPKRRKPAAIVAGQSWRVSMNTGICRMVLAWASPS